MFSGLVLIRRACNTCGLDFRACDHWDAPAVRSAAALLTGAGLLLILLGFASAMPEWLQVMAVWPGVALLVAVAVLRFMRAAQIARHYRGYVEGAIR